MTDCLAMRSESTSLVSDSQVPPSAARGPPAHLRSMVRVSVRPRTLCRRLSSLCGSSFRKRTASTSMRRMARILFCKVGNSPADQEQRVSHRSKGKTSRPPLRPQHWTRLGSVGVQEAEQVQCDLGGGCSPSRSHFPSLCGGCVHWAPSCIQ